jgi:hypothetical protein
MKLVFKTMCYIMPAVLTVLSAVSCVRELCSICPQPLFDETLKIVFSLRPTDMPVQQGREHRVALYVFDDTGRVFDVWRADDVVFGRVYDTGIVSGAGTCELVAWVSSPDEPFNLKPPPAEAVGSGVGVSQAKLELAVADGGVVDEKLPWLFYGAVNVPAGETLSSPVELVLTPDSYIINLNATGLPDDGSVYRFAIRDNNGAYDFRNNYLDTEYFSYSSEGQAVTHAKSGVLAVSLTTLRIGDRRSPEISLVNGSTGEDIFPAGHFGTNDLVRIIRANKPDNDFETEHIYDLDIAYTATSVELRVDGWVVKPQDSELTP